jgi:hypothetical protein
MCVRQQLSVNEENGANSSDVCRIFAQQLNSLYKLAFLLTTKHSLAEQCTIASLDEALTVNGISKASAESWSKRAVIKNALRIVRREFFKTEMTLQGPEASKDEFTGWPFNAIISLQPLERFVFVVSILEKIPDCECSQLFGCAATEIVPARIRALEWLSIFETSEKEQSTGRRFPPTAAYSSATSLGTKARH